MVSASGSNEITKDHIILTEDMFSAIKAQRFLPGTQCIALLGTALTRGLECALLRSSPSMVHLMLDGDEAGYRGSESVLRRLKLLGIPCVMQNPESGDPKDQNRAWFETKFKGKYAESERISDTIKVLKQAIQEVGDLPVVSFSHKDKKGNIIITALKEVCMG